MINKLDNFPERCKLCGKLKEDGVDHWCSARRENIPPIQIKINVKRQSK